ncbi:hypothetical protein ACFOVU_18655 [Nocardiopsis sediminis]|uniref:DUF2637 domain-containing protein n=1 Tax=Nocardiopsis sediminis TaxID=1778267 RepID=A0ABV8FSI7_9ACTN
MIRKTTPAAPVDEAMVAELKERVRVAKAVASIPDLALLDDADTNPAMTPLRTELSQKRQTSLLRQRHKAELRRQEREEFDQQMDDRGHRLVRRRELSESPARKAASLERLQRWVVGLGAAGIAGMGAASTAGVHAGLVALIGPEVANAAWGYEPAVIVLVAGGIVARSILDRSGGRMPTVVTVLEWTALATSIALSWYGSGAGAALFPVGVAVLALVMQQILAAVADANVHAPRRPRTTPDGPARMEDTPAMPAPDRVEAQQPWADAVGEEARAGLSDVEDHLRRASVVPPTEREDDGGSLAVIPPEDDDPTSATAPDEEGEDDGPDAAPPPLADAARRRSQTAAEAVRAYYADNPDTPIKRAAKDLGIDPKTVRKYRTGGAP